MVPGGREPRRAAVWGVSLLALVLVASLPVPSGSAPGSHGSGGTPLPIARGPESIRPGFLRPSGASPYTLTFQESGLPNGTTWQVNYDATWGSSSTSTITFPAINGTFDCGISEVNFGQYLTYTPVISVNLTGTSQTVNVSFERSYLAWFNATGLPNSLSYGLDIVITGGPLWVGTGFGGSSHDIAYPMLNGTYNFTASCGYDCTTYLATPPNGSYTINGTPVSNAIRFVQNTTGLLSFEETGLAPGVGWAVNLTAANGSSWQFGYATAPGNEPLGQITGLLAAGNYSYTLVGPSNYSLSSRGGYLSLAGGQDLSICAEFRAYSNLAGEWCGGYIVTFNASGLPSSAQFCANVTYNATQTYWACQGGGGSSPRTTALGRFYDGDHNFTIPSEDGYVGQPGSGTIVIDNANVTLLIDFSLGPAYGVNVSERGLANGTYWSVDLLGVSYGSNAATIFAGNLSNGSYRYSIVPVPGYSASPSSGSIQIFGSSVTVLVNFTAVPLSDYLVQFTETGLVSGTNWTVTLGGVTNGSSGTSIGFQVPNGTYRYSIGSVPGYNSSLSSGGLSVLGTGSTVYVNFSSNAPTVYTVTFLESGLATGASWTVALGSVRQSSSSDSVEFNVTPGSYAYQARSDSSHNCSCSGSLRVSSATEVDLVFHPDSYALTFSEVGLPAGAGWGVLLGPRSNGSTTTSLGFSVSNGTYTYVILAPGGFDATRQSGTIGVNGTNASLNVTFQPVRYPIVFIELGLPNGTVWGVRIVNQSRGVNESFNSSTNALTVFLPNGTYSISFLLPPGYTAGSGSTVITVDGRSVSESPIHVEPRAAESPAAATRVSPWTVPWIGLAAAGVVAVLVALVLLLARRRERP